MTKKLVLPEGNIFDVGKKENVNNVDVNVNTNKSVNIVIKRKDDDIDDTIRQTYYLRMSTIRSIKKLAKQSDRGVSEVLQMILDNVLDSVEIE